VIGSVDEIHDDAGAGDAEEDQGADC